jgi:hypothetical protein
MSDVRYEIKKLRYLLSDLTWLTIRVVSVRNETKQRTTDPGSRLVDPVDDEDEDPGPQTSGPPTDNVRSK